MRVKSVKATVLEEVGFRLPPRKLLSANDKVDIMEQFLMMPAAKVAALQQNGKLPSFVQQVARLLFNNNLCEYFEVLKMCQEMAREEKQNSIEFLK